jgi:hypothetical protein
VERESFNNLLNNFTSLTTDEAKELALLAKSFPYSQVIHNLATRAAQDNKLDSKEKLLTISAIYSTDRAALKSMMTAPVKARMEYRTPVVTESPPPTQTEYKSNDHFLEELMADLATMRESKKAFEDLIERMENQQATPLPLVTKEKAKPEPKQPSSNTPGDLIEEIKASKKKLSAESTKQVEQNEIIEQFIKTQPSITRKPPAAPPESGDLSEPSGQFGENIVSETLVEILLRQGKKEKAIEALKKLIWKFPQKKAYFAAQIEELRK